MADDEYFFQDESFGGTQVRKDYERAAGRFLVTFNRLENEISEVIVLALEKAGRPELAKPCILANFSSKLHFLDLLSIFPKAKALAGAPYEEMRRIGSRRNEIAHGHFEQHEEDDTYVISAANGIRKRYISIDTVNAETSICSKLVEQIRFLQVYFLFDNIVDIDVTIEDDLEENNSS